MRGLNRRTTEDSDQRPVPLQPRPAQAPAPLPLRRSPSRRQEITMLLLFPLRDSWPWKVLPELRRELLASLYLFLRISGRGEGRWACKLHASSVSINNPLVSSIYSPFHSSLQSHFFFPSLSVFSLLQSTFRHISMFLPRLLYFMLQQSLLPNLFHSSTPIQSLSSIPVWSSGLSFTSLCSHPVCFTSFFTSVYHFSL